MDLAVLKHKVFYGVEYAISHPKAVVSSHCYFLIIAKKIFLMGIKIILILHNQKENDTIYLKIFL